MSQRIGRNIAQRYSGPVADHSKLASRAQTLFDRCLQRAHSLVAAQLGLCLQGLRLRLQSLHFLQLHIKTALLRLCRAQSAQRRRYQQPPNEGQPDKQHRRGRQRLLTRLECAPASLELTQDFGRLHGWPSLRLSWRTSRALPSMRLL